jgi:hypothetical protein
MGSASYSVAEVLEFSGGTFSFVSDSTGTNNGTGTITTGTLTLSNPSVIVAQIEMDATGLVAGTGYVSHSPDGNYVWNEYHITSSSEAATATNAGGLTWVIIAAAFQVSGGGGGATFYKFRKDMVGGLNSPIHGRGIGHA